MSSKLYTRGSHASLTCTWQNAASAALSCRVVVSASKPCSTTARCYPSAQLRGRGRCCARRGKAPVLAVVRGGHRPPTGRRMAAHADAAHAAATTVDVAAVGGAAAGGVKDWRCGGHTLFSCPPRCCNGDAPHAAIAVRKGTGQHFVGTMSSLVAPAPSAVVACCPSSSVSLCMPPMWKVVVMPLLAAVVRQRGALHMGRQSQ